MSALGYVTLAAVALTGAAAIILNRNSVRRWVVAFYLVVMSFLAFGIFLAGPRMALARVEASGEIWTSEKAVGALAMHQTAMIQGGVALLIAVVLAVMVLRRPK